MTYLNLHNTSPTELVSPITALDDNWDKIDSKIAGMNSHGSPVGTGVVGAEEGIEFTSSETIPPDIAVYTASAAFKKIQNPASETWGAWQNITLASGFSAVSGRTPQLKVSNYGQVRCRGAIQYGTGTTAWPTGYQTVNTGQFGSSVCTRTICVNLTATPTGSTTWAFGQFYISIASGIVTMWIVYSGTALASGNRVSLDSLSWYI